jgi:hypothetical protein
MNYVILVIGTPYMDGKYTTIESAYSVKELLKHDYPYLRLEIVKVFDRFVITDDIFLGNHLHELVQDEAI